MTKHKVFISYHHTNDQWAKEALLKCNEENDIFINGSVDTGDISDDLSDEKIRKKIRDEYLRDTTVTILLVGTETKNRKHIDWELYSSMRPLQNSFSPDSRNLNTGFRLFLFQISTDSTQIPP